MNRSNDMYNLLAQLEGKKISVTLRSGECFGGTLLLDHIKRDINNDLVWYHCDTIAYCPEPVIHLHYTYENIACHERHYWILVSEIACLEYKSESEEPHETRGQD